MEQDIMKHQKKQTKLGAHTELEGFCAEDDRSGSSGFNLGFTLR